VVLGRCCAGDSNERAHADRTQKWGEHGFHAVSLALVVVGLSGRTPALGQMDSEKVQSGEVIPKRENHQTQHHCQPETEPHVLSPLS